MLEKSIHARAGKLSNPAVQLEVLQGSPFEKGNLPLFSTTIAESGKFPLRPGRLKILQINLGYMCNQVCAHCHVDAGPDRKEVMTRATMEACLDVISKSSVETLDLTGGAPEMNPHFQWFVKEARSTGISEIIVRSNLTILRANKKYRKFPEFFQDHKIHVISSLPFYRKRKTDSQRGEGVFAKSLEALQDLNNVGYGKKDSGLELDLVYNPSGAFLPGNQKALESEFKKRLLMDFGIEFNRLFTITNLPISRFLEFLLASNNYEEYMRSLVEAYNPNAVDALMCRDTLSVGWDGRLYDCDFNQMLLMEIDLDRPHIQDFDLEKLGQRNVRTSQHCYGCTAGAGSSCQGSLA